MYNLKYLTNSSDLRKILFSQQNTKRSFSVLFVSLWDPYCETLIERLESEFGDRDRGEPLYIVDSFRMPNAFTHFNTQKVPQLVQIRKDYTSVEDYLPTVYRKLRFTESPV